MMQEKNLTNHIRQSALKDAMFWACRRALGSAWQSKKNSILVIRSQRLLPQDFPRRLNMCQFFVTLTPDDISNILFSDEAQFHLDGTINSQNVRRYAPRKGSLPAGQLQGRPNHFRHQKSTFSPHVMVFLGLKGDGTLFGYTKLQGGMNSQAYHTLLQHRVLPEVCAGNGGTLQGLTWQQDWAPPHASDQNIQYLARQFGGRLIARHSEPFGGRDWAARSPDLNPLDYGTGWLFSIEICHTVPHFSSTLISPVCYPYFCRSFYKNEIV